jgi:hypothetical protein
MINQLNKNKKAVPESIISFGKNVGKKRTQNETYLDDIEKLTLNLRKKKVQKSSASEADYDLVPNKEIRTIAHVKKTVPTKISASRRPSPNKIRGGAKPPVSPVQSKNLSGGHLKKNSVPQIEPRAKDAGADAAARKASAATVKVGESDPPKNDLTTRDENFIKQVVQHSIKSYREKSKSTLDQNS